MFASKVLLPFHPAMHAPKVLLPFHQSQPFIFSVKEQRNNLTVASNIKSCPLWSQLPQVSLLWCESNHCPFYQQSTKHPAMPAPKVLLPFHQSQPFIFSVKERRNNLTVASKAVHSGLSCPKFLCCGVNQITVLFTNRAQNILPCLPQKFYFLFIKVNPLSFL